MKTKRFSSYRWPVLALALFCNAPGQAQPATVAPAQTLTATLTKIVGVITPREGEKPQTFSANLQILRADGLPKEAVGQTVSLAFQAPDKLRMAANWAGNDLIVGRDGQKLWVYMPQKKFGLIGTPDAPRFSTRPDSLNKTPLGPLALPLAITPQQLALLPLLLDVQSVAGTPAISAKMRPQAAQGLNLPANLAAMQLQMTPGENGWPSRLGLNGGEGRNYEVALSDITLQAATSPALWQMPSQPGDKIETVALSHLLRFFAVATGGKGVLPTLGALTGEKKLIAREGKGRLEMRDGTRVLFLEGTPEEMGRQQGTLLKSEVHDVVNRILYGVGVGSSFAKGSWFFGEIEAAQNRLNPHMNARYGREADALALAAGLDREEVRLANFFPELFHCSGFALAGAATEGGVLYHGRILDYLKGMGLEQNAVIAVVKPDVGHAWVNLGYAGFTGTVTAMNDQKIAIGEMGGRGEGNWDGKPMAHLMREVMENASTLDEAVAIFQNSPRTCEYYYVISDGKTGKAVGIKATPTIFQTIQMGEAHVELPHAMKDAVLMSAGERYETLAQSVQKDYGKIDAEDARNLMCRPVAMTSNIQSVLFAPTSLDFWVANADAQNVASHTRYTHYNLGELLSEKP